MHIFIKQACKAFNFQNKKKYRTAYISEKLTRFWILCVLFPMFFRLWLHDLVNCFSKFQWTVKNAGVKGASWSALGLNTALKAIMAKIKQVPFLIIYLFRPSTGSDKMLKWWRKQRQTEEKYFTSLLPTVLFLLINIHS